MEEGHKLIRQPFLLRFKETESLENISFRNSDLEIESAKDWAERDPEREPPKEPTAKGPWGD